MIGSASGSAADWGITVASVGSTAWRRKTVSCRPMTATGVDLAGQPAGGGPRAVQSAALVPWRRLAAALALLARDRGGIDATGISVAGAPMLDDRPSIAPANPHYRAGRARQPVRLAAYLWRCGRTGRGPGRRDDFQEAGAGMDRRRHLRLRFTTRICLCRTPRQQLKAGRCKELVVMPHSFRSCGPECWGLTKVLHQLVQQLQSRRWPQ